MAKAKYNLKLAVVKRFLRAWLPQLALGVGSAIVVVERMDLPENYLWLLAALGFLGAVATALDKLLRELEVY